MNTYLFSIHPKWCEKIFNGEKTIEVRKTAPKPPFKVVVYCTKKGNDKLKNQLVQMDDTGELKLCSATNLSAYRLNGKVIGEFVCNTVENIPVDSEAFTFISKPACLTTDELIEYCSGKDMYGLHISDLKVYDKPKELSEVYKPEESCCFYNKDLGRCDSGYDCKGCVYNDLRIKRPPQSYMRIQDPKEV